MLSLGPYRARLAQTAQDMARSQALRQQVFRAKAPPTAGAGDADAFDSRCLHVLIEGAGADLLCCYRLLPLAGGATILSSYSAQFYDLTRLTDFAGPMLELGRFCLNPAVHDPDVLRIAWAAMTRIVDDRGIRLLFGCSSFVGADPAPHAEALAYLARNHLAPDEWSPGVKNSNAVAMTAKDVPRRALLGVPPLLRTYLRMGGWVSNHAVPDLELDTLHVFTGVEIDHIPAARARALRAMASA